MTHFGIICPPTAGHLNPMTTLGSELIRRGHQVTLFGILDAQPKTLAAGLAFQAIGEKDFPKGATAEFSELLGVLSGFAAVNYTINWLQNLSATLLREAPESIKQAGVEALLVDQSSPEGGTVAEFLGIPFITVCTAIIMHWDTYVPPYNTAWSYSKAWWSVLRNQAAYTVLGFLARQLGKVVVEYRRNWNLPPYSQPNDVYSPLAQLSQQPAEFEFPRTNLPQWFHFTGPYNNPASRERVEFPWSKLNGKPLIYASMGTLQNRLFRIFEDIAKACAELDAQLVISLGGATKPESLPQLPGEPIVVDYAPQLELLQKASLTITHAGMNTTLESLSNGVPMVAIPITNDQPGVAARIAWTGTGEVVPLAKLSIPRLRNAIARVLSEDSYKQNALRLQEAIRKAGGVSRAADIVEKATFTRKPVLSQ